MPDNQLNPVLGIDLGTTYSCVAQWAGDRAEVIKLKDGEDTLPSVLYVQDSQTPLVGIVALRRLITDPPNGVQHAKRHIGDDSKTYRIRGNDYTPVDVSAMILERLKADVEGRYPSSSGFELAGVVVTHPQYFKYPQIAYTQEAVEKAELPIIRLLSEPVAAALDYGFSSYRNLDEPKQERLLVFDLGGGTFDVTVLEIVNVPESLTFRVLSVGGDAMLGGTNFDEALKEWALAQSGIDLSAVDEVSRRRSMASLTEAVVRTKETLSTTDDDFVAVANILPGKHLQVDITRDQFNTTLDPFCTRIRSIVSDTLASANLRPGELDRTIMIGGSSRIPIMRQIVQEETGKEPWANADPDLSVCRGAAFLAAMDDGRVDTKKEIIIEEATSHALGVRASNDKFSILIPPNRPAPVEATRIFSVRSESFTVTPYQGKGKKVTDEGVIELKPIPVSGVELNADGQADVKITFTVNDQQILFVKVEAPGVREQRQMEF